MNKQEAYQIISDTKSKMASYTKNPTISPSQYMKILDRIRAELGQKVIREILDEIEDNLTLI